MKTLLTLILAVASLTANAELIGLPLHFEQPGDEKLLYAGENRIVQRELVTWVYPFKWAMFDASGGRITIPDRQEFAFEGVDDLGRWIVMAPNGQEFFIPIPPNNVGRGSCFKLQPVRVQPGLPIEVLINRLGEPQRKVALPDGGGTAYLWFHQVEESRSGSDFITKNTDGYIGGANFSSTSTTEIPYTERRTYTPYHFAIKVDGGTVSDVMDLWEPSKGWQASR